MKVFKLKKNILMIVWNTCQKLGMENFLKKGISKNPKNDKKEVETKEIQSNSIWLKKLINSQIWFI